MSYKFVVHNCILPVAKWVFKEAYQNPALREWAIARATGNLPNTKHTPSTDNYCFLCQRAEDRTTQQNADKSSGGNNETRPPEQE